MLFRRSGAGDLEVLLVHPGGPLFVRKDEGVWSVPKGEYEPGDDPLTEATREFAEEIGTTPPDGERIDLGSITQRGGKVVRAWAVVGDLDTSKVLSNDFEMEWPPRSGVRRSTGPNGSGLTRRDASSWALKWSSSTAWRRSWRREQETSRLRSSAELYRVAE
jgi:predicted NUDIX family NTP pyrophosphohydrolase